jgi:uncharacterized membrane protein YhaH (DUF805 family)
MFQYLFLSLNNYANFSGRASRKEYWLYYLTFYVIQLVLNMVLFIFIMFHCVVAAILTLVILLSFGYLFFIPDLSFQVRRLHDIGKGVSGWWLLLPFFLQIFVIFALPTLFGVSPHFALHLLHNMPIWVFHLFRWMQCYPIVWSFLPIHVIVMGIPLSLRGSYQENRFGLPPKLDGISQRPFTLTKKLKNALVAFIFLFVCILSVFISIDFIVGSSTLDRGLRHMFLGKSMDDSAAYVHSSYYQVLEDDSDVSRYESDR